MSVNIIACGGRDFSDRDFVYRILDKVHAQKTIGFLIQGGQKGADRLAAEWSFDRGVRMISIPAEWKVHGGAAGPMRNREMLEYGPTAVVAFPGGRGTASMIGIAKKAGIFVWEPDYDPA